ncbi:hypothetical protein AB4Z21_21450 [Paenibacillus sp. MCAF20]
MFIQAQIDEPLPSCTNDCLALIIRRIEMFVIPDYDGYCAGYRVCLHLATTNGLGWGELFVNEADKPADWIRWGSMLHRYIGEMHAKESPVDNRIHGLFNDALLHVRNDKSTLNPAMSGDLLKCSVSYISLF